MKEKFTKFLMSLIFALLTTLTFANQSPITKFKNYKQPCTPNGSTFTIASCDSFYWPEKNLWYYNSNNTDTLWLTNVDGCDSIVTLDLTIHYTINVNTPMVACDSFSWSVNGKTYYTSGNYADTTTQPNGCLNIINLQLTINNSTHNVTTIAACDSFIWNGRTYTTSATDTFSYFNSNGCESVDTLHLTINTGTHNVLVSSQCDSLTWYGTTYYASGVYTHSYLNGNGCTSEDTLKLTITKSNNTYYQTACDSYTWNGKLYTASTMDTFGYFNGNGCFSVDTLYLTIRNSTTSSQAVTVCDSLWWNGTKYTTSGTYTWTGINAVGCDSVATLNLTVNNSSNTVFTVSACGTYTWTLKNKTYTASNNTDTVMLKTVNGCDSIITLNLTILANISGVQINNIGAYCGDTAKATLSTNINSSYGTVSYQWSSLPFTGTGWQFEGNDSVLNIAITEPRQYVLQVTIAGCGTYWSNQEMVMPVKAPQITLAPNPTISICNNSNINFTATNNDGGINNFTYYQNNSIVQNGLNLNYATPNLTTANDGVAYKLEATNVSPTFDGNINENFWGIPLTVSTWGPSSGFGAGHELNAIYARADANNIYLAIAGNVQNQNRIMLFVDSKTGGYNTGNYGRGGIGNNAIRNFNSNNVFDPGFNPDYCIGIGTDATRSQFYFDIVEMKGNAATGTSVNNYIGSNLNPNSGFNLGASPANNSQTQGFEMAIPKSALGYTSGDFRVFALYSADNGFLSNQFLTRATISSGNYGNGTVNFGQAAPDPIAIPVSSLTNTSCKTSLTTVVTVKANATSVKYDTVCNNQLPYNWSGKTFTTSGTYYDTAIGSNNCDSFATLHLLVKDTSFSVNTVSVCNNQLPYNWNGNSYNVAGTYTWSGKNIAGCDSSATLILSINDTSISNTSLTVCDSLVWNGVTYKTSGTYTYHTTNVAGCDSVATLNLTVNNSSTSVTTITTCDSLIWNGVTYKTSGIYTFVTPNAMGCDSIATLQLTINYSSNSLTNTTVCNNALPFIWNGNAYNVAGTYTFKTINALGCDSTATLILTLSDTTTSISSTAVCDSIWWNGSKYTASGTYTWKGTNAVGCDSIAILNLTVNQSLATPIITIANNVITPPQTGVVFNCSTVPNATSYIWSYTGTGATIVSGQTTSQITVDFASNATTGLLQVRAINNTSCYSLLDTMTISVEPLPITLENFIAVRKANLAVLNWNSVTEFNAKEYQVQRSTDGRNFESISSIAANGFASSYNFIDNRLPSNVNTIYYRLKLVDKDGIYSYSSIKELSNFKHQSSTITLYPNPTKDQLNINIEGLINTKAMVTITDILGKQVMNTTINSSRNTINVSSLQSGSYFITIVDANGKRHHEKFIKE